MNKENRYATVDNKLLTSIVGGEGSDDSTCQYADNN